MKALKILSLIVILATFAVSIYYYQFLPETLITHWDSEGLPNGTMGKFWGLFLVPIISLVIFLLFIALPYIDPLKNNIKKFMNYYDSLILIILLFLLYLHLLSILWNLGYKFQFNLAFIPAFAFLFIYIGFIMNHLKRNWFIGIRTPWTMSSDHIWEKTHRLGSRLFVASGIISLFGILLPNLTLYLLLMPIILSAVFLVVYSYIIYRKKN